MWSHAKQKAHPVTERAMLFMVTSSSIVMATLIRKNNFAIATSAAFRVVMAVIVTQTAITTVSMLCMVTMRTTCAGGVCGDWPIARTRARPSVAIGHIVDGG